MIRKIINGAFRTLHYSNGLVFPLLNVPVPELLSGKGKVKELPKVVKSHGVSKVLVVTDKGIMNIGLAKGLLDALEAEKMNYVVFDEVQPNPTIPNIEAGLAIYKNNKCDGIIAFGGGSPMDCAKIIGARAKNPKQSILKMRGMFRIWRKLPPIFAVPTTAGTGSETTVAAIVTNPETHEKFAVISFKLVPLVAVLDPELMIGLPPHITSTTGMDALTHAVEAYIGLNGSTFTNENAEKATKMIFEDLEGVYKDGSNIKKRNNLALASFYAGSAFTRAQVGYVHAIAHNMGGMYGVPHGLANAIILPYILEISRKDAEKKLAKLAIASGIGKEGESTEQLSNRFIEKVKSMNKNMGIPTKIKELKEKDIPLIAQRARAEAHPMYPVPTLLNQKELESLIKKLLP